MKNPSFGILVVVMTLLGFLILSANPVLASQHSKTKAEQKVSKTPAAPAKPAPEEKGTDPASISPIDKALVVPAKPVMEEKETLPAMSPPGVKTPLAPAKAPAAEYEYTAKLKTTVKKPGQIKAGAVLWNCSNLECTSKGPWPEPSVAACNALFRVVGQIVDYGHSQRRLSPAELKQCNVSYPAVGARPTQSPLVELPSPSPIPPAVFAPSLPLGPAREAPSPSKPAISPQTGLFSPSAIPKAPFAPSSTAPVIIRTETLTYSGAGRP